MHFNVVLGIELELSWDSRRLWKCVAKNKIRDITSTEVHHDKLFDCLGVGTMTRVHPVVKSRAPLAQSHSCE